MRSGRSGDTGAAPPLTWRSLGPGWGIRRVRASPRARCAPGRRRRRRPPARPAPALAAALALHGTRGLAPGSGKLVQLAAAPRVLTTRQWLLAFPRPASARPSSASALFPPLLGTGQTGFSAPGSCLQFPFGSLGAQQGLGAGPAVRSPFVPPGGGEGLDRESLGGQRGPDPASCPLCAPAAAEPPAVASASSVPRPGSCGRFQLSGCSRLPGGRARHPAPPDSRHFPAALGRPGHHPGSVTAPARKAGGPRLARDLSSLGKGSCTLSMPSHVPG